MRTLLLLFLLTTFSASLFSQHKNLQSGPMLGYVDMKEAMLWVQTKEKAKVWFEYWEKDKPEVKYKTTKMRTRTQSGFTAHCVANQLEPGRTYVYQLRINGKKVTLPYATEFKTQPLWQYRTDPPVFSVATGSCAYINEEKYDRPGKPYGSDYQIFKKIADKKPEVMLWLGDNTYLREPDWYTKTGMIYRNTHTRSLPEMQALLASSTQLAIWDDHDFGPNNSDGTWVNKDMSWEVFQDFWANPTYGLPGQKGCTTFYNYGDVDFFLLDNRYYRAPNTCNSCERTQLGKAQMDWLIGALTSSRAPFKLVAIGGQVLTDSQNDETFGHFFKAERDTLLARIERENIRNVVFLTGDRHFTEMSSYKNAKGNMLYDLTASPFTSGVFTDATKEKNSLRIDGTLVTTHNFALLTFTGPRKERKMQVRVYDSNGTELWMREIESQ